MLNKILGLSTLFAAAAASAWKGAGVTLNTTDAEPVSFATTSVRIEIESNGLELQTASDLSFNFTSRNATDGESTDAYTCINLGTTSAKQYQCYHYHSDSHVGDDGTMLIYVFDNLTSFPTFDPKKDPSTQQYELSAVELQCLYSVQKDGEVWTLTAQVKCETTTLPEDKLFFTANAYGARVIFTDTQTDDAAMTAATNNIKTNISSVISGAWYSDG